MTRADLSAIPAQQQKWPGTVAELDPQPDHGESRGPDATGSPARGS